MIGPLSPVVATRLEKVAIDNGFDQEVPGPEGWLAFASTRAPLRIWLSILGDDLFLVGFSQAHVADALEDRGTPTTSPLPAGATAGRTVSSIPALHSVVRRAFQLSRTLPDELLHTFKAETAELPRSTEAERLVIQRVGQNIFREGLLDYWEGRCAITGLAIPELLRASHIKPWAECESDAERLDVFNGILLAPNLDAAFDRGYITIMLNGTVAVSPLVDEGGRRALGLVHEFSVPSLSIGHHRYLEWHRDRIFRAEQSSQ